MLCTECVVFDHHNNTLSVISNAVIREESDPGNEYERHHSALISRLGFIRRCLEIESCVPPGINKNRCNIPMEEISTWMKSPEVRIQNNHDQVDESIQFNVQETGPLLKMEQCPFLTRKGMNSFAR